MHLHTMGFLVALAVSPAAFAQARVVKGTVYAYEGEDGKRHYTNVAPIGVDAVRTIKYNYYEGQKAYPPYVFRCRVGDEDRYFSEPFVGCVVVGAAAPPKLTFGGFDCKGDCSGHQAGYEWATKNFVSTISSCNGGGSQSFIEGCMVRARGISP